MQNTIQDFPEGSAAAAKADNAFDGSVSIKVGVMLSRWHLLLLPMTTGPAALENLLGEAA